MRADLKATSLLTLLTLLTFATVTTSIAYAAPLAVSDKNWEYSTGNSWAWNYSPQTQINKDNVKNLEVKWVFPVGSRALAPAGIQTISLNEGANTPPIVHNGVVYITTNFLKTYAIDAKTGKQLWTHDYEVNIEEVKKRLPWAEGPYGLTSHLHGFRYWEGGDALLITGMACDFFGVDAKTGETKFWVKDLCLNVPGNIYKYRPTPNQMENIGTYEKGRQFIYVMPGMIHDFIWYGDARHVTMGIDMDTHQVLWRVFSYPPQDRPVKDWALQECDIGWFQTYRCTDVAAKNRAGLEWDWAFPGENPSPYGGVTSNWGTQIVDEDTGILYTQTGNQGPYTNTSLTPGPRLYGSTIMAIDMNKGQRIWWLQPFPHDPHDYDCNWSGILAEVSGLGKVYMKGCKEGRLYVMDAATGKPHYVVDVIKEQVDWGQVRPEANKEWKEGGVKYHLTDPFSYTDLREWKWVTDGLYCTAPCNIYPHWFNGLFGTDMSYDPETQTLYHYANAVYVRITAEHPYVEGESVTSTQSLFPWNSTIVARDAATGKVKWTWFYGYSAQRAAMVVTGGMVFTAFTDGYLRFFDKDTGQLLHEVNLGSGVVTAPTIGKDSDGNSKIFVVAGPTNFVAPFGGPGYGNLGPMVPGTLMALGLAKKPAVSTTTVTATTTSATTVTTTVPQTTVTSTVTSSVTQTVEAIGPVTYAAVAVAVVAIIAAAILATRRRAA